MSISKRLFPLMPGQIVTDTSGSVGNQGYGLHIYSPENYDTVFAIYPSGSITKRDQTKVSSASIMYVSGNYHSVANKDMNATALFNGDVFISGCLYVAPNSNDNTYLGSLINWKSFQVSGSRLRTVPQYIQGCYGAFNPSLVDGYAFHSADRVVPYHVIATHQGVYNILGIGNYGGGGAAGTYDRSINMFGVPINVETIGRNIDFYVSGSREAIAKGDNYGVAMFEGDIVHSGSAYHNISGTNFRVPRGYVDNFVVADFVLTGADYFLPVTHSMGSEDLIVQTYESKLPAAANPVRKVMTGVLRVEINSSNNLTIVVGTNNRFNGQINILALSA